MNVKHMVGLHAQKIADSLDAFERKILRRCTWTGARERNIEKHNYELFNIRCAKYVQCLEDTRIPKRILTVNLHGGCLRKKSKDGSMK